MTPNGARPGARWRKWKTVTLWTVGLLAVATPRAFAAVTQDLFAFHIGFHFGAAPQLDRNGNLLALMDFGSETRLVKFNADGQTVWMTPMPAVVLADGTPEAFLNSGCHIVVDGGNNAYVNSFFDDRSKPSSVVVTRINASGSVAWSKAFAIGPVNASEHNAPGPMAIGSDGSVYVVAHSGQLSAPTPQPTTLLRIDPANGNERNRQSQLIPATTDFTGGMGDTALAADGAGNVYYGGPQGLMSFSQNLGTRRWFRTNLMPRALAVGAGGGALYVTGVGSAPNISFNMFVARLASSTGNTVWSWSSGNETHAVGYPNTTFTASDDRAFGGNRILVDSTGQVYAGGHGADGAYRGGIVAKFDQSSGARLWLQHYGPSGTGAAVLALAVDNLNDIYVSGQHGDFTQQLVPPADRMILSPTNGSQLWLLSGFNFANRDVTYESVDHVVVDGNGNTSWKSTFNSNDQGSGEDVYTFRGPAIPDATYSLVALHSGMALDDPGSSQSAGLQMQQWTVNNGANQKWSLTNLGNNTVRLVNQASGLTLGVRNASTSNGAAVEQNIWNGGTHQQWVVTSTSTLGFFTLKNVRSGQLLDVVGASPNTGALIDQWPSNGGNNQKWRLQ
jgi:hypothetical protein